MISKEDNSIKSKQVKINCNPLHQTFFELFQRFHNILTLMYNTYFTLNSLTISNMTIVAPPNSQNPKLHLGQFNNHIGRDSVLHTLSYTHVGVENMIFKYYILYNNKNMHLFSPPPPNITGSKKYSKFDFFY